MQYIKKSELYQRINLLENAQDKFMVLAIYHGINGKNFKDLIELKESDIDMDKKVIKNKNNIVHMDEVFFKVTKEVLEQKVYYKKFNAEFSNISYEFNSNSKYVLKSKPSKLNNFGINAITINSMYPRYNGSIELMKLEISAVNLKNSKIVDDLNNIKSSWKLKEVREFFKKHFVDASAQKIFTMLK